MNKKLVDILAEMRENGKLNNGITFKKLYGNPTYYSYTASGELIAHCVQTSKGIGIIEEFCKENSITLTEIDKKPSMWNDNYRNENGFNPTEQAPSFKSKW